MDNTIIVGREEAQQRLSFLGQSIEDKTAAYKALREQVVSEIYEGLRRKWVDVETEEEHVGLWSAEHESVQDWLMDLALRGGVSLAESTAYDKATIIDWLMSIGIDEKLAVSLATNHQGAMKELAKGGAVEVVKDASGRVQTASITSKVPSLASNPQRYLETLSGMSSSKDSSKAVRGDLGKTGLNITWMKTVNESTPTLESAPSHIAMEVADEGGSVYGFALVWQKDTPESVVNQIAGRIKKSWNKGG